MDISVNSQSDAFSARTFINVPDIDSEDGANPQLVSIYVNDIYDYMRSLEVIQFFCQLSLWNSSY